MPSKTFPYRRRRSGLFGEARRPLVDLEAYSKTTHRWILLEDLLADTGADVSILPRRLGILLVKDVQKGRPVPIRGVAPGAEISVFFHRVRFRFAGKEFPVLVAIADSDDVPPILGRVQGLDRFNAAFRKGRQLKLDV